MFDCWLGLRKPEYKWRLVTAGEILAKTLIAKNNPVKCLRIHTWDKYIHTMSEDMKHYNIIGDTEYIRKVTITSKREVAKMSKRRVEDKDKYLICPVQTTDGALSGTVNCLCSETRVSHTLQNPKINEGESHIFINNEYVGQGNIEEGDYDIIKEDHIIYIYDTYGRLIPGKSQVLLHH